ncbi:DUF4760 domain-containing protein [Candidatus Amarolinea aalborgensis]|uniref:DUF4760 domain-containing protein n=1 Tax=Candidatus Amarolinea aalborgensis TaxID=2249329 RepID=UPI003BFA3792
MPIFRRNQPASTAVRADAAVAPAVAASAGSTGGGEAAALLHICQIITSDDFDAAYHWLRVEFGVNTWEDVKRKCPRGSRELRYLQRVVLFVDTLGDLLRRGQLPETPVFKLIDEIGLNTWEMVLPWVADARRELANPALYANLESLAGRFFDWQREG